MVLFYTKGKRIVVIAAKDETVPLEISMLADFVSVGDKVIKSRWAH